MFVPFNTLPNEAKIWIYMSDKEFTDEQVSQLSNRLENFCNTWKKHGENLKSSYLIKYNRFIVLGVDESFLEISGCAINKSIQLIQNIESEFGIELMNRLNTAFQNEEKIEVVALQEFKEFAKTKTVNGTTIVFNNLATTKAQFEREWEIPASQSWHSRFLN
jgi:hypothetical protein